MSLVLLLVRQLTLPRLAITIRLLLTSVLVTLVSIVKFLLPLHPIILTVTTTLSLITLVAILLLFLLALTELTTIKIILNGVILVAITTTVVTFLVLKSIQLALVLNLRRDILITDTFTHTCPSATGSIVILTLTLTLTILIVRLAPKPFQRNVQQSVSKQCAIVHQLTVCSEGHLNARLRRCRRLADFHRCHRRSRVSQVEQGTPTRTDCIDQSTNLCNDSWTDVWRRGRRQATPPIEQERPVDPRRRKNWRRVQRAQALRHRLQSGRLVSLTYTLCHLLHQSTKEESLRPRRCRLVHQRIAQSSADTFRLVDVSVHNRARSSQPCQFLAHKVTATERSVVLALHLPQLPVSLCHAKQQARQCVAEGGTIACTTKPNFGNNRTERGS
mmetsp:Transcript_11834/g.37576  ORF Transcript_11834/g.37576 Transcript_11834/m.37576 type:complete len:388 (+) Transcript_11834:855-2018(+)